MKIEVSHCDVCGDKANIVARIRGAGKPINFHILINASDGHGDYTWHSDRLRDIDLCQKHKDQAFKILTKLFGKPKAEK